MSKEQTNSGILRKKKELAIVIIVALVIMTVASVYVISYFRNEKKKEEIAAKSAKEFSRAAEEFRQESENVRATASTDIPGNYMLMGETSLEDPSRAYSAMRLLPDGTVSAQAFDGSVSQGWWHSQSMVGEKNGDIEIVAVLFPVDQNPTLYAVWNDSLFEWQSAYLGHVEFASAFDSTFISSFDTGTMTIDISSDGGAYAEFIDTNDESENKGLKYVYSGDYSIDDGCIDITLNGATTKFLMFDYAIEGSQTDSGIAPVFYKKYE